MAGRNNWSLRQAKIMEDLKAFFFDALYYWMAAHVSLALVSRVLFISLSSLVRCV